MTRRRTRLAAMTALAGLLILPAATLAASPAPAAPGAPPATVVAWQEHLDHMRSMGPNLGSHVRDCVATHGSMAGLLGPNGMMVQGMDAMMGGEAGR